MRFVSHWLTLVISLLALAGVIGFDLYSAHENASFKERERLTHQTRVINDNLSIRLQATNRTLELIRADLPGLLGNQAGMSALKQRLRIVAFALPGVSSIQVVNVDGIVMASNLDEVVGVNFRDSDRYKTISKSADPATLFISAPFVNRRGIYAISLAKAVLDAHGNFAGFILVIIDPDYFRVLLSSVLYEPDMRSQLIHGDGKIVFRVPDTGTLTGMDLGAAPNSMFNLYMKGGQHTTTFQSVTAFGEDRLVVFDTIKPSSIRADKDLVISVSRDVTAIYAPWRKQLKLEITLLVLLAMIAIFGLFFYQRRQIKLMAAVRIGKVSEDQLRLFYEQDLVGLTITSPEKGWIRVNQHLCNMLEYSESDLHAFTWAQLTHPDDLAANIEQFDKLLAGEIDGFHLEKRFVSRTGKIIATNLVVRCVRNENGDVDFVTSMVQNITERKQAEASLLLAKDAAELANNSKSRFLAAASHDLRQPAHALGMFIERLDQLTIDPQSSVLVASANAAVREMQDMLDGMFDLSHLDSNLNKTQIQTFSINALFDGLRNGLANEATAKGLRFRVRPSVAWLQSDATLLRRILLNLVGNSIRYTKRGSVLVACRPTHSGTHMRIEVWDSGIGIAPEDQEKVFQEFYQVANPQRDRRLGLGIGLSIVERSCRLLTLPLSLRSALGAGTRVTIWVPLGKAQPELLRSDFLESSFPSEMSGHRVMVIEDDEMGREALAGLLESWGYLVIAVEGAKMAAEQLQKDQPPDMIISDFRLGGGINGIEAVRMLRNLAGQDIAACVISGDTDAQVRQQVEAAGLVLLSKPVRPAKLRSLLNHLSRVQSAKSVS